MKPLLTMIFAVAALAMGGVATKTYYDNSQAQRAALASAASQKQAMQSVINRQKDSAGALHGAAPHDLPYAWKRYAKDLDAISTSECPADFRHAWLDYTLSVHRYCQDTPEKAMAVLEAAAATKAGSAKVLEAADATLRDSPVKYYAAFEHVAINYGLEFPAIVPR